MKEIKVVGLMSGTSMDGVDLAYCSFTRYDSEWQYSILHAETYEYEPDWKQRFIALLKASAMEMAAADAELGILYATMINDFVKKHQLDPQLIASHGHTIFHQPAKHFTTQIGSGAHLAALTGIDTVCDFRSKDVALGGQGAPLVPFGEMQLFSGYHYCLNLGGIANISRNKKNQQSAFDICIANMALNEIAAMTGKNYDEGGRMAMEGNVIQELLDELNNAAYFQQAPPKSLGREWYEQNMQNLLNRNIYKIPDLLKTVCMHIGMQTGRSVELLGGNKEEKLLITGGGAFNKTLVDSIAQHVKTEVVVPDALTVSFKEALIFAFLGALNYLSLENISNEVTGSSRTHIGGALYKGK
jgi:anhydro-N-acetylmuramic acid kinase